MNRFENGFDSYEKAITALGKIDINEYDLKDIVISLHHAIEVLFKNILSKKNKSLVYKEINKWIEYNFNQRIGNNKSQDTEIEYTITFDETVKRIVVLCEISIDTHIYGIFTKLNKLRNSLTHDELEIDRGEVEHIVVNLLTVVMDVLENNLSGAELEKFTKFVSSEDYANIVNKLYSNNFRWRIITISNLLKLYSKNDYSNLTNGQIKNIQRMISALGIYFENEDVLLNVDGEYYSTIISYLKQEMCNLIICHKEEIIKDKEAHDVLKKDEIIQLLLNEYLQNAALYIRELLLNEYLQNAALYTSELIDDNIIFKDIKQIEDFLQKTLFVNKNDIFQILEYMKKILDAYEIIMEEKRRDNILKRIFLGDDNNTCLNDFYSVLKNWFLKNGWYNIQNANKLSDIEKEIFFPNIKNDNVVSDVLLDINRKIYDEEIYDECIGEFGNWGSIDRVDTVECEKLVTLIKDQDNYTVILEAFLENETYWDHEYFDNGIENVYFVASGKINDKKFIINDVNYIGKALGFNSFRFF